MGRMRRKDERRKRDRKYWLLLLLMMVVGSLLLVTVSYTVGSTVLNIVGFNATQTVSWDVQIANVSASRIGRARFSRGNVTNTMIKGFGVTLIAPGDGVTMTFDIVNKGTLNAKLDYFSMGRINCTYQNGRDASDYCHNLYYMVEYANGRDIKVGDVLDAGQTRKVKVTLKYYDDAPPLWDNVINIDDIDISFIFGQK